MIGRGYGHEAVEVRRCLAEGLLESPLVPHAQTLTILRQMDDVRRQVGVRYAGDATTSADHARVGHIRGPTSRRAS